MNLSSNPTPSVAEASTEITVTSWHSSPVGGGVLIGAKADGRQWRVLISPRVAARDPEPGEVWRVTGEIHTAPPYGDQLRATVALPLLPSGRAIVRHLATGRRFPGVGWKTADRLWSIMGERLYDVLHARDAAFLAQHVGAERAVTIVSGFGLLAEEVEVFRWLDRYGVSPRTASAVAGLWGGGAIARIEADPYALALLEPWSSVDARALRLGVGPTDPRRTRAGIEEALNRLWRLGRTAGRDDEVAGHYTSLLAAPTAAEAIADALAAGRIVRRPDGLLQSRAARFMEDQVSRMLTERLARPQSGMSKGFLARVAAAFEDSVGHRLVEAQREAVRVSAGASVAIIMGGAGTGKTTVVRAVLAASDALREALPPGDRPGFAQRIVAVAGRAAKRAAEATGREAWTVARFLRRIESGLEGMKRGVLVMDEASMLDLPTLYRILVALPTQVDLLLVGDPAQLPPIGPGSPFHDLTMQKQVRKVALDVIHRQAEATGIPPVAAAIRAGRLPGLPPFDGRRPLRPGVFLAQANPSETGIRALSVFRAMAGAPPETGKADGLHALDIQVLCPLKGGEAGSKALNEAIEREWMAHQAPLPGWGLSIGSKVLWLRNDYRKAPLTEGDKPIVDPVSGEPVYAGFFNGALGMVRRAVGDAAWLEFDDGAADLIRQRDLEMMTRGWAISVHKAQGSAFRRVIVSLSRSRLLDRSLIYTAVTRATETVVLVGDPVLLRTAVEAPPRAQRRPRTITLPAS